MIIGLTGEHCAGKGTFAEYLKKKGFYYLSLSDVIREEIAAEGKEITRDALIEKGNSLRKEFGPGVLAKKSVAKIKNDRNYVVDSIMNPVEVEELRKLKGFFLVYVTAPPEVRFERMKARGRENDPNTFEAFLKVEKSEMKSPDMTKHQQQKTDKMADKKREQDKLEFKKMLEEGFTSFKETIKPTETPTDSSVKGKKDVEIETLKKKL